jgi:hypothetical protein
MSVDKQCRAKQETIRLRKIENFYLHYPIYIHGMVLKHTKSNPYNNRRQVRGTYLEKKTTIRI